MTLYIYGKPLCSACIEARQKLYYLGVSFEKREFALDRMCRKSLDDIAALAMYHYQDETLPVFVLDGEGLTFQEVLERFSCTFS